MTEHDSNTETQAEQIEPPMQPRLMQDISEWQVIIFNHLRCRLFCSIFTCTETQHNKGRAEIPQA